MPTPKSGYRLNGRSVPSVSTVLNGLGWGQDHLVRWAANLGLQGLDYEIERQKAADIGTIAHELIAAHLLDRAPVTDGFAPELIDAARPCFDAYRAWARGHRIKILASEQPLVSSALAYGGTFDAVVRINDSETVLMDFKSSNWLHAKNVVQVVAYLDLIYECLNKHLNKAIVLRVGKDGEFKALTVEGDDITRGREAFYHLLQLYKLKAPLEKLTRSVNTPGAVGKSAELTIMGEKVPA